MLEVSWESPVFANEPGAIARAAYECYVNQDRAKLEQLIAEDFHFTSPLDNRIDRKTYFERCWPNSENMAGIDFKHMVVEGDRVFVVYESMTRDGKWFRNCELVTVRDGQLTEVEVYFGWDLPHKAAPGGSIDPPD
jgi:ketosteroid isomerase-like protein